MEKSPKWLWWLGGRKFFLMCFGGVVLDYICVIWSYLIRDWDFARFFTSTVLVLIISYAIGNVTQKKILNGGENDKS